MAGQYNGNVLDPRLLNHKFKIQARYNKLCLYKSTRLSHIGHRHFNYWSFLRNKTALDSNKAAPPNAIIQFTIPETRRLNSNKTSEIIFLNFSTRALRSISRQKLVVGSNFKADSSHVTDFHKYIVRWSEFQTLNLTFYCRCYYGGLSLEHLSGVGLRTLLLHTWVAALILMLIRYFQTYLPSMHTVGWSISNSMLQMFMLFHLFMFTHFNP